MTQEHGVQPDNGGAGRPVRIRTLFLTLAPSLAVILVLFGGGLVLGFLQALGYLPGTGHEALSFTHFANVLSDPDFAYSFGLTLYVAFTSTVIAAAVAIGLSLAIMRWAEESRLVHFLLQIPLTVPHLVIAVSVLLLLTPSGLLSRLLTTTGILPNAAAFPLLVNDRFCIGIMAVYIWKEIPFITFMLLAVLKNLGPDLLEAAATLNASRMQRFRYVILPVIGPSLGGACLIVFGFTFGAFEVPYLLGRSYPLTMPVWSYKSYSDIDLLARPEGIALGLLISGLVIIAVIVSHFLTQYSRRRGLI